MAKRLYVGNGNIARNVKSMYVGVNGVARKVKKGYIGVGGVARQFYGQIYIWKKYKGYKETITDHKYYETVNGPKIQECGCYYYISNYTNINNVPTPIYYNGKYVYEAMGIHRVVYTWEEPTSTGNSFRDSDRF